MPQSLKTFGKFRYVMVCMLFILHPDLIMSQKTFREGYIITNQMDTIRGLVQYRNFIAHSKSCVFKRGERSAEEVFMPFDIIAYRFDYDKYYVSMLYTVGTKTMKIFAEYLVDGITDLYFYRDQEGDHYLIEKEKGRVVEVSDPKITDNISNIEKVVRLTRKIGTLKATFSDCPELIPAIEESNLSRKSIVDLTTSYHDYMCEDEKCIVYKKEREPFLLYLGPSLGIHAASLDMTGKDFYESIPYPTVMSPSFGLNVLMPVPLVNERIRFQLDALIGYQNFSAYNEHRLTSISYTANDYQVDYTFLKSGFSMRYAPLFGKFRPFFNFGLGYFRKLRLMTEHIETKHIVTPTEDVISVLTYDIPLARNMIGPFGRIGCNYHFRKKMSFSMGFHYDDLSGYVGKGDRWNRTRTTSMGVVTALQYTL